MSVNVKRTNESFEEWYNNTMNPDINQISICINYDEGLEWIFWFTKAVGAVCPPIHIINIYPDDSYRIIGKIMSDEIESRIYNMDRGFYKCSTYIYVGKEIPDLSFLPDGARIEMFVDKKEYIKPIIKDYCYSFGIFDFDYKNIYMNHIIDLSKCNIGEDFYFYEHKVIPPFNYYIVNNFKYAKIRI